MVRTCQQCTASGARCPAGKPALLALALAAGEPVEDAAGVTP
ncbi:MAG: hypothetical protein ACRDOL_28800 [Streptosporangiaceae bacterium]